MELFSANFSRAASYLGSSLTSEYGRRSDSVVSQTVVAALL